MKKNYATDIVDVENMGFSALEREILLDTYEFFMGIMRKRLTKRKIKEADFNLNVIDFFQKNNMMGYRLQIKYTAYINRMPFFDGVFTGNGKIMTVMGSLHTIKN